MPRKTIKHHVKPCKLAKNSLKWGQIYKCDMINHDMEGSEVKTSKFSSGLNIIMRLDELWKDTHKHSRAGEYQKWNSDLDRMWLELARDLDEADFPEYEKKFNQFDKDIQKIGNFKDKPAAGFKKAEESDITKRGEHYQKLIAKQLFISRLENKLGKGTTFDEGDDDDFD